MIILYGGDKQFSSWSMRAYILLAESNLNFEYKMIGLDWPVKYHEDGSIEILTGEDDFEIPEEPASGCGCQFTQIVNNDTTNLIKNSFTKYLPRVPILVDTDNDVVVSDVLAMEDYLRNKYNVNLLSDNIKNSYEILNFCSHIHADILPLMSEMSYSNSFRNPNPNDIGEKGKVQLRETLDLIGNTLNHYKGSYLFGNQITFADIMFAPIAQQFYGWNIVIDNIKVKDYIRNILNHPSIKRYLDEAKEFYNNINNSIVNSPKWIVSHYRYHPTLKMLNNPKYDIYHILDNDISEILYELSIENYSVGEIIEHLSNQFQVDKNLIRDDINEFFKKIHPNTMYKDKLKNA